jgi:apolipoprotein N-acyltransferase
VRNKGQALPWQRIFALQFCIFFSGLLAGYSFTSTIAPVTVGLAWILFLGITATTPSVASKALAVFLFAFGLLAGGAWWIYLGIRDPQNNSLMGAILLVSFVLFLHSAIHTIVFAVAHTLFSPTLKSFSGNGLADFNCTALILAITWPLAEFIRSIWFWAFPWMFIGYSQVDNPLLLGLYPIVGVYGVSCAALLLYTLIYMLLSQIFISLKSQTAVLANQTAASYALLLGLLSTAFGMTKQIEWTLPLSDQRLNAKVFHTELPNTAKYRPENQTLALQALLSEAMTEDGDLAVFPEVFISKPAENLSRIYTTNLFTALNGNDKTLLFGVPVLTRLQNTSLGSYNAAVQLNRIQEPTIYAKEILVPFTEYLPWNPLIRWAYPFLFKYPLADNISGLGVDSIMKLANGIQLGPSICYEIAFPYHGALRNSAAHVLVNLSSDSWIDSDAYFRQAHQMARVRAAEAQKPLLRSNNVGVSAILDARGEELNIEFSQDNTLIALVTPRQGVTPFAKAMKFLSDALGKSMYPY